VSEGEAAKALALCHRTKSHDVLLAGLNDPSKDVRFSSAFSLGEMAEKRALPSLQCLTTTDRRMVKGFHSVAKEAANAIENIQKSTVATGGSAVVYFANVGWRNIPTPRPRGKCLILPRLVSIFEKIIEGRARVIRTLASFARGFFFDHHSNGVQRTLVLLIFGRNSGGNRLIAFKAAGGIEVLALLAGMQGKAAFRTLPDGLGQVLEQRATFGATGNRPHSGKIDGTWSEGVFFFRSARGLLEFFFRATAGILIPALAIFAIGQKMPPLKKRLLK
jgi:hypothetical protein